MEDPPEDAGGGPQRPEARTIRSTQDFCVLLQEKGGGTGPEPATRKELLEALLDLVRAYSDPQVQEELLGALQQCEEAHSRGEVAPESEGDWVHCLRLLLTPLQIAVARDHGYSASVGGLQKMQNAVIRRICEGDLEFRRLANEALGLLALPQVVQLTEEVSAQELLRRVEAESNRCSSWTPVAEIIDMVRSTGKDASGLVEKFRRLRQRRRAKGDVHFAALACWAAWERYGFGRAFVCRPPEAPRRCGGVPRLCRPSRDEVFRYVMENRPVVITGVLDTENFPPLEDFADFEYLKSRCGHRQVKMKGDHSYDGEGRKVFVNNPGVSVQLAEYLDMIQEAESRSSTVPFYMGKVLLSEEVPEMLEDVEASLASPLRLYGSAFGGNKDGVHSYFGCGQNTTSIHADPSENILVVVFGEKTFQLFPPWDADCLYTSMKTPLNSCVPPFTRPDDMPQELRDCYPLYEHAAPVVAELSAGDILYLPIFWWHGVSGGQGRNMLLNWWCKMHPSKVVARAEPEDEMSVREFVMGMGVATG